ncbi:MAG: hypothetical protein OEQ18_16010 [Gammaproteobacteria bacterium]|nr:hypothetical protein [Gammaproteobacteria bacterium]
MNMKIMAGVSFSAALVVAALQVVDKADPAHAGQNPVAESLVA